MHQTDLTNFIRFFEALSQENVALLGGLYSTDASFKDPFNDVKGVAAIISIFEHMFTKVDSPKFVVTKHILQGEEAFIVWDFIFKMHDKDRTEHCIHGSSHLRFAADHKVHYHRDYWDTSEELYEKIPVLGIFMCFLKNKVRG